MTTDHPVLPMPPAWADATLRLLLRPENSEPCPAICSRNTGTPFVPPVGGGARTRGI